MEIKREKTVTETIEVNEFPVFRKSSAFAYKVLDDKNCIQVYFSDFIKSCSIEISSAQAAWRLSDCQDCTEDEFNEVYDKAINQITSLKEVSELELQLR